MDFIKKINNNDGTLIDITGLLKFLFQRIWIVAFCAILFACGGFGIARFLKTPMYSSSVLLYVNNSSFNVGSANFSISSSQIDAAQSLVKTYAVLLNNRTTLEEIISKSGVDLTSNKLSKMISASQVNNTEVLKVTVTSPNPYLSKKLVNCIAEVLPQRVSEIIHGSSMEIVDSGVANLSRVSPSYSSYTFRGFLIGIILPLVILCILFFMDSTIHDEDYLMRTYKYPILVTIPSLEESSGKKYGYYSKRYGSYYKNYYKKSKYYAASDYEYKSEKEGE